MYVCRKILLHFWVILIHIYLCTYQIFIISIFFVVHLVAFMMFSVGYFYRVCVVVCDSYVGDVFWGWCSGWS